MRFRFLPIVLFTAIVLFFFSSFIFQGRLPIPSDTIVGLYHPFRDVYSEGYPNGIPFKNSLITDPVRQQYPWRELVVSLEKKFDLPFWNPYSFSGTPLLGNMQSAALYPLNILFIFFPFNTAWIILIILGPLLGGLFLYYYLNNLKINKWASLLGALGFSFSGFFIAWMEWGTIPHVALWLPLALLSIDKIFLYFTEKSKIWFDKLTILSNVEEQFKNKNLLKWGFVFVFSLVSSFFAGHLQIFFYLFALVLVYFIARWVQLGMSKKMLLLFLILNSLFLIFTSVQWLPTLQFILHSAREVDQVGWQSEGWFVPWHHLIQFIAPDFFGNPTTLNYWGAWNYGELVGYVGILPFLMAVFALFFRHDKKTLFFGTIFFLSLIFSLPTILAKLPYQLNIPFLLTSQPTRLLFIADFSLAVLAAFGFDYFIRVRKKEILYPLIFVTFILGGLWGFVIFGNDLIKVSSENLAVAKNNLILPSAVLFATSFLIFVTFIYKSKMIRLPAHFARRARWIKIILLASFLIITIFDLLRFAFKFTPFTQEEYLFPSTKTISFLQEQEGQFRIMSTDKRIFPPNFSVFYRLQSVDGYDPLYLRRYGELVAASERGSPDISPPFGFNRIITPQNFESKIIDLLGVKYVLSLTDLESSKLAKVFQEGETRVYENKNAMPRAFFVEQVEFTDDRNSVIRRMFEENFDPAKTAIVEDSSGAAVTISPLGCAKCKVKIVNYEENRITIDTESDKDGFLVLVDNYYSSWRAKIDGVETKIFRTNYNFRGIVVPSGKRIVEFSTRLL
ncbi:MAG: hypothetical protein A2687_01500 [Candidatus Levybacteria bacterium RIFCSPHIGHO2_01_FULL_38_26]|nr:MAG: hypothetical protein A2687_01500 [Candidatus Levybacteria bacterium RIFCSPHIGHO2_01_FULL_38_26]